MELHDQFSMNLQNPVGEAGTGDIVLARDRLQILSTFNWIRHQKIHILDERIYFFDKFPTCLTIAASLQSPVTKPIGTLRVGSPEHIEGFDVPEIDALLDPLSSFLILRSQLGSLIGAEADMTHLFLEDLCEYSL